MGLVSVIDIGNHTAFHLDAIQTPSCEVRKLKGINLVDHYYAQSIIYTKEILEELSCYLCVDTYFEQKDYIDRILQQTKLSIITRLRCDANCKYIYNGPARKGKGVSTKYDGKVDWKTPNPNHFKLYYQDEFVKVYDAILYCIFLKRKARVSFCQNLDAEFKVKSYKIYVCTDLKLPALLIQRYYKVRFQQGFLIRDSK